MIIRSRDPVNAARELQNSVGWTKPTDFSLDEIAAFLGILVRDIPIEGSEGRILMKGERAIISINDTVKNKGKRNFILGHELGHFILHKELTPLFSDTDKTLSDWFQKGPQEEQANKFASELLMPSNLFKKKVEGKKLDLALIEEVSTYFQASLLATFIRYARLESFPIMIIFMENNHVKWKMHSHDFPFIFLPINSEVPASTVAGDFFIQGSLEDEPEKVDAIEWFPDDFQIKFRKHWKLWEQCYRVGANQLVLCLWTY